jgi:hypothetical protein
MTSFLYFFIISIKPKGGQPENCTPKCKRLMKSLAPDSAKDKLRYTEKLWIMALTKQTYQGL